MDKLAILILEDVEGDAKLMERALKADGIEFSAERVETRAEFIRTLRAQPPDLILADYKLPEFNGRAALKLAGELAPGTPLIIVTGALVDNDAVELLREGASDYILKDRLSRLAPAVHRALEDARLKAERLEAEAKYRTLFNLSPDGIVVIDFESGRVVDCNPEFEAQIAVPLATLRSGPIWEIWPPEAAQQVRAKFQATRDGTAGDERFDLRRPDGTVLPIEFRTKALELGGKRLVQAHVRNISERLRSEAKLRAQIDELRRFQRVTVDRELRMQELEERLALATAELARAG